MIAEQSVRACVVNNNNDNNLFIYKAQNIQLYDTISMRLR
jgi:hypothetical protein